MDVVNETLCNLASSVSSGVGLGLKQLMATSL